MNYGKLTAGTTKTAIDTAKLSEQGEIIAYLSRMGDVLEQITNSSKAVAVASFTVHTIIDSDKAHIVAGENDVRVLSNGQVISAKPTKILDQPATDKPLLNQCKAFLHAGTVKIGSRISVIHQNFQVGVAMLGCVPG